MSRAFAAGRLPAALRRDLGPLAWCALECLVEQAGADGTAEASVRSLAADLGVAKNTAHRALGALAAAGLIEPEQQRARDGRYREGRYRLHLHPPLHEPDPDARPTASTRRRVTRTVDDGQLSLLPDV